MKSKGFTILEVITAIFILSIGVGASLSLINQTLSAATLVEQKLIASYLAQEGIEIVRNIRDTNWLQSRDLTKTSLWDDGLLLGGWQADYTTLTFTGTEFVNEDCGNIDHYNCQVDNDDFLYLQTNDFYGYEPSSAQTRFRRKITIAEIDPLNPDPNKRKVIVEVKWEERGRTHSFTALEYITNWYEQ